MTTLYRFFAADDRLLYVGIAGAATQRWEQHAKEKGWWGSVARVAVENYPTRAAAAAAERNAIRDESPVYNVVHNRHKRDMASRPELRWYCDVCRKPVADGGGYLQAVKAAGVRWFVFHRHCDPFIGDPGYWIAVEMYRTPEHDTEWYRHLVGKAWFNRDDWDEMTERSLRYPDEPAPGPTGAGDLVQILQAL